MKKQQGKQQVPQKLEIKEADLQKSLISLENLEEWDNIIFDLVKKFGLNCYPQDFEICDHFEMLGYMAYSGMTSRYPHWSFGKAYERQKTLYDYGVGGLPYEMVINSNPCLAYLMRDNTLLLHILTIAHVYGHNDFFANNFTFTKSFDAKYTFEMFKTHAARVRSYIEDPSIGIEAVEEVLDSAHALSLQHSRNLAIRELTREEEEKILLEKAQPKEEQFDYLQNKEPYKLPNLNKHPLNPVQNILSFVAQNSNVLNDWQRDLLMIVDKESKYFIPQIETKIMNEGWASFWHHRLLNQLNLEHGLQLEFMVRHNQVLRPTPGGLNPYHLGFIIWKDIEKRWNTGETGREYKDDKQNLQKVLESSERDSDTIKFKSIEEENNSPGRKKIFEVRQSDRDSSFLRRFLTKEIMQELDLFEHERKGKDRVISKISDEDSWQSVKDTLVNSVGMGSIPVLLIQDADFGGRRALYIKHEHDGRDLQLEYAEKTLEHLTNLWGKEVYIETVVNEKTSILSLATGSLKVERI